mgnify:FL=1|tara:strand:- start:2096 stop:2281 length:186 start_codon:yes stop_codon:yes gene_type:complete
MQKLLNDFFWHRKLVWILLILILQILNQYSFFIVLKVIDIDQLIVIVAFSIVTLFLVIQVL